MIRDQNYLDFIECSPSPPDFSMLYTAWTLNNSRFLHVKHMLSG
jgi:hypothetical protein